MRMKVLFALTLILNLPLTASAQDVSEEIQAEVMKLIEVTKVVDLVTQMIPQISMQMAQVARAQNPQINPRVLEIQDQVVNEHFNTFFSSAGFLGGVASIYGKLFTIDEIRAAIAFYESPVGQKFISNQTAIATETQMVVQRLIPTVMPLMQRDLMEKLEAEGLSLQPGQ